MKKASSLGLAEIRSNANIFRVYDVDHDLYYLGCSQQDEKGLQDRTRQNMLKEKFVRHG